jgi:hypothetical protein
MENIEFVLHVNSRLDELKEKRTAEIAKEKAAGTWTVDRISAFSKAKSSFKKLLSFNIATPDNATLYEVFTDKQIFTKYGDFYYAALLEIEHTKAAKANRKINTSTARVVKGDLKIIFEVIGKELKLKAAGVERAAAVAAENAEAINLDGMSFCETLNALCENHFPDTTSMKGKARHLGEVCKLNSTQAYLNWIKGDTTPVCPSIESLKVNIRSLEVFEMFFGITKGTLTKFMPSGVGLVDTDKMKCLLDLPDKIASDYQFSDKTLAQFKHLEDYKKGKLNPLKVRSDVKFSKFRDISDLRPSSQSWTDSGGNDESRAAQSALSYINTYRHWLIQEGVISDPELFKDATGFYSYLNERADEICQSNDKYSTFIKSRTAQRDTSYKDLVGSSLKNKIINDPIVERLFFIEFVKNKGIYLFTELEGFVDFDLSHLLRLEHIIDFCIARKQSGVSTSLLHFLSLLKSWVGVSDDEVGYLSLMHAPTEQLYLDEAEEESFKFWLKDEKSLVKYLAQEKRNIISSEEELEKERDITVGKRNIQHLISSAIRAKLHLSGGVKEGHIEYMRIVTQLENDAKSFGNTFNQTSYHSSQTSLFMRMMLEQPMRVANWRQLRIVTYQESLNATFPCIWKHNRTYRLRVPPRFVKNRRKLETTFTPQVTKAIDNYLDVRSARLEARGATSDNFLVGYDGGLYKGNYIVIYTYKAQKVLWPEREFITWGFNAHSLRHFAATVYMAYHPEGIFRCADLIQDKPQTVLDSYIEPDKKGAAKEHTDHNLALQKVFEVAMAAEAA